MGRKRSATNFFNLEIYVKVFLGLLLISAARVSLGLTNPSDVAAINNLYAALGSPTLPEWVPTGGDPCGEAWQGVRCNVTDIISIIINAANLGGELGDDLGSFSSIRALDLSNNHIGGSIPNNLPKSMQNLFLSDNQFTGSIPSSLSSLTQLSAVSLNDNQLSGELPDGFESLTALVNLDLSSNNLSGKLPPSMEGLSSLVTLHLQNNQLSGTLDILQDLPLRDLNIENNLFNGPIPDKLLSIPNFKKDGNPFNTTAAPLPSPPYTAPPPPAPPFWGAPTSEGSPGNQTPGKQADGPSAAEGSNSRSTKKRHTVKRAVWISIAVVFSFIILVLALLLLVPTCCRRRRDAERISKRHEIAPYVGSRDNPGDNGLPMPPSNQTEKVPRVAVAMTEEEEVESGPRRMYWTSKTRNEPEPNVQRMNAIPKRNDHEIDMSRFDIDSLPPPPAPPPPPPPPLPPPPPPLPGPPPVIEKVDIDPVPLDEVSRERPLIKSPSPPISVKSYSIASLQQYTNSFSHENLIGGGMLGSVYRAELPNGKLLAVKKLDKRVSSQQKDLDFLDLVNNIDKIRHANVVELMGYCAEHGQRLFIHEYCSYGTLQDALHSDDELKKELSWNIRIRMALGAARALEYLHEVCEPPIIHRNFKSANILLDDELAVHVSDCGLAPLISAGAVSQLSGQLLSAYGYGAPEFESGVYTIKSDVYSFGVVMLELLTGRQSYDRTRDRGEQFLVRWAIPQLHDIDALSRMVDPALDGRYPAKSLSCFADIISRCVQTEPEFRPPMSAVVQDLVQMIRRESANRFDDD